MEMRTQALLARVQVASEATGKALIRRFDGRALVLAKKFPSPAYSAAMVWMPCDQLEMVMLATPLLRLTGEPRGEPSPMNWTVPVGTPALGARALRVAVKATLDPVGDGLAEEVTTLAEDAGLMVRVPLTKAKL